MLRDEPRQVVDVLVGLHQQVREPLVLLLVDQLPVALLVLRLGAEGKGVRGERRGVEGSISLR